VKFRRGGEYHGTNPDVVRALHRTVDPALERLRSTAAGADVAFPLSSPAGVTVTVRNMAGRPVRSLCRARECPAGANRLAWNAVGDSGLPVPRGVYVVEVVARGPEGAQSRAVTPIALR
jgi:hypothetical protein